MKLAFCFLSLLFGLQSLANPSILSEKELLKSTGLPLKSVISQTEASLEKHLFQEAHGRSCGLQHYTVEAYETSDDLLKHALKNFSVITEVYGPIYLCKGYEYFLCATQWSKQGDSTWRAHRTSCESDHDWGALLYDHTID